MRSMNQGFWRSILFGFWIICSQYLLVGGQLGFLSYEINYDANTVTITNCNKEASGEIRVPSEIEGLLVTTLGERAFADCVAVSRIFLPESLNQIGLLCFASCEALKDISIPNGIIELPDNCFRNCFSLEDVELSENLIKLGNSCFWQCVQMRVIGLPEKVSEIGNFCFEYCRKLVSINIPSGVTAIPWGCFRGCRELISVRFSGKVKHLEAGCFEDCWKLANLDLPETLETIGSSVFKNCRTMTRLHVPTSVYEISDLALHGLVGLAYCQLPSEFDNAYEILRIGLLSSSIFESIVVDSLLFKVVHDEAVLYKWLFPKSNIVVPDEVNNFKVTAVAPYIFDSTDWLESVILGEYISRIHRGAFESCLNLSEIKLGNNLQSIESYAFHGCESLVKLSLPDNLNSIGGLAFSACSALKELQLPDSVNTIGYGAFSDCSSLASVELPDGLVEIASSLFSGCVSLQKVVLPTLLNKVRYNAFFGCESLASVEFGNSVEVIEAGSFSGCRGITSMSIPDSVTELGRDLFQGCSSLEELFLPNHLQDLTTLKKIGAESLFKFGITTDGFIYGTNYQKQIGIMGFAASHEFALNHQHFGKFVIPTIIDEQEVKFIADYAFTQNATLNYNGYPFHNLLVSSIEIPETVEKLGKKIFDYVSNRGFGLTIIIPDNVHFIEDDAFSIVSGKITSVIVGGNSVINTREEAYRVGLGSLWPHKVLVKHIETWPSETDLGLETNEQGQIVYSVKSFYNVESNYAEIPEFYNGIPITKISPRSGYCSSHIEKIKFGDNILSVAANGLSFMPNLKQVVFNEGLIELGDEAFAGCINLEKVVLPKTLNKIGSHAFSHCFNLSEIVFSERLREDLVLGDGVFSLCSKLSHVKISSYISEGQTFAHCLNLQSVELSPTQSYIGPIEFYNCPRLHRVSGSNQISFVDVGAFSGCVDLSSVYGLPNSIEHYELSVFDGCNNLSVSEIPSDLHNLDFVYRTDYPLTSFDTISEGNFKYSNVFGELVLVGSDTAELEIAILSTVNGYSVSGISSSTWSSISNVETLSLPESVKYVEDDSFVNLINLKTIRISPDFHSDTESNRIGLESLWPYKFRYPDTYPELYIEVTNTSVAGVTIQVPVVHLNGEVGQTGIIQYSYSPHGPWVDFKKVKILQGGLSEADLTPRQSMRFYRFKGLLE